MAKRDVVRRIDFDGYAGASPRGVTPTGGLTADQIQDMINDAIEENNNSGGGTTPAISMTVSPSTALSASGLVGSTFSGSVVYTLTNTSSVSINWEIIKSATWVSLTSSSGTLAASASTTVTASINNAVATTLAKGEYVDVLIFNASASGATVTVASRMAQLSVNTLTIYDVIRSYTTPVTGSGASMSVTLPSDVEIGDGLLIIFRHERYAQTIDEPGSTLGGFEQLFAEAYATDFDAAAPNNSVALRVYSKAAESGDAGATITFEYADMVFDGNLVPYDGDWAVMSLVIAGNSANTYVTWGDYGIEGRGKDFTPPYNSDYYDEFGGMTTDYPYQLTLWMAAGFSSGSFSPSNFVTKIAEGGNLYVAGKLYSEVKTIASGGMTFNADSNYFVAIGTSITLA